MGRVGVIGGTGLYSLEGLEITQEREIETPFGKPSAPLLDGRIGRNEVVFLPRHGQGHQLTPGEINYRANIFALKTAGVESVISVSAVGSLKKEIHPGELALPSQYIDFTKGRREPSFFGRGMVAHVSTGRPICQVLSDQIEDAGKAADVPVHRNKTYACVEGPRLGTQAESFFFINAGCDLVGMTNVPEVFLAREAQLSYCTIAVATDYDCWMDDPSEHVNVEQVISRYLRSISKVQLLLERLFQEKEVKADPSIRTSLQGALLSNPDTLSQENRSILEILQK